jgi:hypothetical protein
MVMEAVMVPNKEVLEDKQKVAKQSKIASFFTKCSVSLHHALYVKHHENFLSGALTSFQYMPT